MSTAAFPAARWRDELRAWFAPGTLVKALPSRAPADARDRENGWWEPGLAELRIARRDAASARRATETRRAAETAE